MSRRNEEEIYRLWWKYLKLNKDYSELCELIRSATETPKYLTDALAYYQLAEGAVKRRDQKLLSKFWTTAGDRVREAERLLEILENLK